MTTHRLRDVALVLTSNVDKVIDPDERPVRLCNYVDVYKNNFIHNDMPFKPGSATAAEIKKFKVQVDDVIITKDSETADDIGVPSLVKSTADDLVCGYHLSILRADRRRIIGPFLYWHLLSKKSQEDFGNAANGVTRYGLTLGGIKGIPINVPDLATQRQIADFLDRETARIDLLIAKKQRLVDAIKAKISDFADLVVTQGLNVKSQMKQAQLPWIDVIPSHWAVIRGKYLFRQMSRSPRDDDEIITAFRDGQVCLRSKRRTEGYTFAELEVGYQHIKRGDLVIHTMDAFAGAIGVSEDDGKSTGEYAVCTPIGDHNTTYFAYLLRCMAKRDYISVLCPSVRERAPRFRFVRFAPVFLPVPPKHEQDEIVDAIEQMRSGLSTVQTKTIASIDRLQEYRSALITAAVTGQIDVQTYANSRITDRRLDAIQEEMGA